MLHFCNDPRGRRRIQDGLRDARVLFNFFAKDEREREEREERKRARGARERNFAFNGGIPAERENSLRVTRENSCGRYQIALLLLFSRETKRRDRSSVP